MPSEQQAPPATQAGMEAMQPCTAEWTTFRDLTAKLNEKTVPDDRPMRLQQERRTLGLLEKKKSPAQALAVSAAIMSTHVAVLNRLRSDFEARLAQMLWFTRAFKRYTQILHSIRRSSTVYAMVRGDATRRSARACRQGIIRPVPLRPQPQLQLQGWLTNQEWSVAFALRTLSGKVMRLGCTSFGNQIDEYTSRACGVR